MGLVSEPPPPEEPYATPTGPPPDRPAAPAPYAQAPYAAAHAAGVPRNGLGTAALVLGILGLLSFWTVIGGLVLGLLGLIFGIIGYRRARRHEATNSGMALAGAITGGIGLALGLLILAVVGVFFIHHKTDLQQLRSCLQHAQTHGEQQQCRDDFQRAVENS
jgi:hypothetical protein